MSRMHYLLLADERTATDCSKLCLAERPDGLLFQAQAGRIALLAFCVFACGFTITFKNSGLIHDRFLSNG